MKVIIRAIQTEPRASNARLLAEQTDGTVIWDTQRDAMHTLMTAFRSAGDDPAVYLEDDIELTADFMAKAGAVIAEHADEPVQFYSDRQADLTVGPRREPGRTFLMAQCFYLPSGMNRGVLDFEPTWPRRGPGGTDLMLADYFRSNRVSYWLHVPSLVQHQRWRSVINPRRSSARTSRTFIA